MASVSDSPISYPTLLTDPRLLTITLVSFVATFGSYAASPALPSIVSEADVGLVMAAYTLPAIFLLPLVGVFTDMYGRRSVLLPSLVLFGVAGVAIAFVDSFRAILALRVLQGVGGAAIIPIAITLIGDLYADATGSAAQGIRLSANGFSSIALPAVAGFLAGIAWHHPFLLFATAFPAAALTYVYVPETLDSAAPASLGEEIREYAAAIRVEVTDLDMAILLVGGFFQGFSYYALLTYTPLFAVEDLGTSVFLAGAVLSARGVARIVLSPATGLVLQHVSRRTALVGSLAITAVGLGAIGVTSSVLWLGALIGIFGIGDALFTPVHRDAITDLASEQRRGGVVSGMLILRQLGTTVSPPLFGLVLVVADYGSLFALAALVYLVYAVIVLVWFSSDG
jgi:MFS family permease